MLSAILLFYPWPVLRGRKYGRIKREVGLSGVRKGELEYFRPNRIKAKTCCLQVLALILFGSCTLHNCNVCKDTTWHQPGTSLASVLSVGYMENQLPMLPNPKKGKQCPTPLLTILNQEKGRKGPNQRFHKMSQNYQKQKLIVR